MRDTTKTEVEALVETTQDARARDAQRGALDPWATAAVRLSWLQQSAAYTDEAVTEGEPMERVPISLAAGDADFLFSQLAGRIAVNPRALVRCAAARFILAAHAGGTVLPKLERSGKRVQRTMEVPRWLYEALEVRARLLPTARVTHRQVTVGELLSQIVTQYLRAECTETWNSRKYQARLYVTLDGVEPVSALARPVLAHGDSALAAIQAAAEPEVEVPTIEESAEAEEQARAVRMAPPSPIPKRSDWVDPRPREFKFPDNCRYTERDLAAYFLAKYGSVLRFNHDTKQWLMWDSTRWAVDRTRQVSALVQTVAQALWHDSTQVPLVWRRKIERLAETAESVRGMDSILAAAARNLSVATTRDDWDQNPWLLNLKNGTLDLRLCELLPHDPQDAISTRLELEYTKEQDDSDVLWRQFVARIFDGDEVLINWVQRAVGYSLTADVSEHKLFVCYGTGANGKSTFLEAIRNMLGPLGVVAAPDLLTERLGEEHPASLAALGGKRFVTCQEVRTGRVWDDARVKSLTGGDAILARGMRQDFRTIRPTWHLWIAVNHVPNARDVSEGLWRRLAVIPFTATIPAAERDPSLPAKLAQCQGAILRWAVEGLRAWYEHGLRGVPKSLTRQTMETRLESDPLYAWMAEQLELVPTDRKGRGQSPSIRLTPAWDAFHAWYVTNYSANPNMARSGFCAALRDKGLKLERFRDGLRLYNVRWRPGCPPPRTVDIAPEGGADGPPQGDDAASADDHLDS